MVIQLHPSWLPNQTNLFLSVKERNSSPDYHGVFLSQSLLHKTAERREAILRGFMPLMHRKFQRKTSPSRGEKILGNHIGTKSCQWSRTPKCVRSRRKEKVLQKRIKEVALDCEKLVPK